MKVLRHCVLESPRLVYGKPNVSTLHAVMMDWVLSIIALGT